MPIDFQHIPVTATAGGETLTIDQLLAEANSFTTRDPHTLELQRKAQEIKVNALSLCRDAFKGLVPDIDNLESNFRDTPERLRIQIISRIESRLLSIDRHDGNALEEIGRALGKDPLLFGSKRDFQNAMANVIMDGLYNPSNLADALNVLSSGKFLDRLVSVGAVDISILDRLKNLFQAVLDLASERVASRRHGTTSIPAATATSIGNSYLPVSIQANFNREDDDDQDLLFDQKEPSIFDMLSQASEQLGLACEEKQREHDKKIEQEYEARDSEKKKRLEEIADEHPEFREALLALLADPHFTDGPISKFKELMALAQLDKSKVH